MEKLEEWSSLRNLFQFLIFNEQIEGFSFLLFFYLSSKTVHVIKREANRVLFWATETFPWSFFVIG